MREKEKNMAKKNYYAVKQGKVPGIYRTWDACKAQVHGYPGAIYKGFERLKEAEAFLGGGKMPEPLLRETKGTYFAAPERKAVQSTAAPDPSSWDWEHLILAEKPCEDPEYAGTMTKEETLALQVEGGVEACMKHFIARGGDSSFADARSDAQTVDNWMKAWEIALSANPKWVMTNGYNTGLTNTVHVDYDKETMDYLRKTLGFEGIIVSDWGDQGDSNSTGVTVDGIDVLSLSIPERYAMVINNGLD